MPPEARKPDRSDGISPTRTWTDVYNDYGEAASNILLNKPPIEKSMGFLRRCSVLATLCNYVYSYKASDVGSNTHIPLLLEGMMADTVAVTATLGHFREAADNGETSGPQQFGIWSVHSDAGSREDDFIAVVFRGTSSMEDVLVDANIAPQELSQGGNHLSIHRGFYTGATEHVDDIVRVLRQEDEKAHTAPVWVSGHSLGGAYANALILHLLTSGRTKELFQAGGGSCTFGAPMVVHSADKTQLYSELRELEDSIALDQGCYLSFHNFVNNADPVPRLLGGSLDAIHGYLESKLSQIKNVRQIANQYHPFGQYHLVIGSEVRSMGMPESSQGVSCRLGDSEYASRVNEQLDLRYMWRMIYGTTGKGAGWTPHNMTSYQERLATHTENLVKRNTSNDEEQLPISLYAPADGERHVPSKLGAGVNSLLQAGAMHAGKAAYAWWTSSSKQSTQSIGSSSEGLPSSSRSSRNADSTNKEERENGSNWTNRWVQKSRWSK